MTRAPCRPSAFRISSYLHIHMPDSPRARTPHRARILRRRDLFQRGNVRTRDGLQGRLNGPVIHEW